VIVLYHNHRGCFLPILTTTTIIIIITISPPYSTTTTTTTITASLILTDDDDDDACCCDDKQGVSGVVEVQLAPGKKLEHMGIKIELVGTIGE